MAFSGIKRRIADARERRPVLDHAVRTVEHYTSVNGNQQAAGATYFAFLSVFPVLALAFFTVGWIAKVYPDAQDSLLEAIDQVLPGLVGGGENEISLDDVQSSAGTVGLLGLAGVLYAGLGWLSSLRTALIVLFQEPERLHPNFVIGKLRDLTTLVVLGTVLMASVAISGVVTRLSGTLLEWLGLESTSGWLLAALAVLLGVVASTVLFFLMFRMLARPPTPTRSLAGGALLGAVGFELLKQLSGLLLAGTRGQPAFQAFGIALILLVWINYFSKVVLLSAAWAHQSPAARAARPSGEPALVQGPQSPPVELVAPPAGPRAAGSGPRWVAPFAGGAAAAMTAIAVLRKKK